MHLLLRPIFCQSHPNFINVCTAYTSEIWAQLTKNLLTKSSTKRFREYIIDNRRKKCLKSALDSLLSIGSIMKVQRRLIN